MLQIRLANLAFKEKMECAIEDQVIKATSKLRSKDEGDEKDEIKKQLNYKAVIWKQPSKVDKE